ncbi:MAG: potassium channel family protein [Ilumatobacter sp.]|nr:potassium channel family protein [Ilumatobacter sp.]
MVLEVTASGGVASSARFANWVIWALFLFDLLVRLFLTTSSRWRYLAGHWFDVGIVVLSVVPIFQPLRALRSARALRVARSLRAVSLLARFWHGATRVWDGMHGRLVGVAVLVIVVAGAVGTWTIERHQGGPIRSLNDATWWAFTTVTTVGYGDTYPVTPEGRAIAVFLMLSGIAVFGVVSANLAALFVNTSSREAELESKIDQLSARIDELIAALPQPEASSGE